MLRRYGLSVGAVAVATCVVLLLAASAGLHTNLPFVAAVVISGWYCGRGPGLLASIGSLLVIGLVFRHSGPLAVGAPRMGVAVYLTVLLLVASIIGATTEAFRAARAEAVARAARLRSLYVELEQEMEEVQTLSKHLKESNDALSEALERAEDLAVHAMMLQEVTAKLSQARTESEVASVVLGRGMQPVEALRGVLVRIDGERLHVSRAGDAAALVETELPSALADETSPLVRAIGRGTATWLRSNDDQRSCCSQVCEQLGLAQAPACVLVPLRHADVTVGALVMVFADQSAFGAAEQAFSLLLAQAAADALFRARSFDTERIARQEAELIARARADVLGIVAHDLRNPLHLIGSATSLLGEAGSLSPQQLEKTGAIVHRAVRRMNRLIGDLLDVTRLEAGSLSLDLSNVDGRAIVRDAEETLLPAATERRIALRTHVPDRECVVSADEGRLLQVLGNLVANALKFCPSGGTVELSVEPIGLEVVFSVIDDGPGIPSEHQEHLFDRFWQAGMSDRRGVGLGLAIAKGIVDAHQGRIWVESTLGVGSKFSFALPGQDVAADSPRRSVQEA